MYPHHNEGDPVGLVISLCDLSGVFVQPWTDAGHRAILVDPQHGLTRDDGPVTKLALTVEEALPELGNVIRREQVVLVAGWPPCTDLAISGARWFAAKRASDPMFQAKAVAVAEQCRTVGQLSGAPWLVENPVSVLRRVFGKASHTFHPADFTALEPADNYTKRTCLWTGGGFVMPAPQRDDTLGPPDDRIHKAPPSAERGNIRSVTPSGFSRAVYAANRPDRAELAA
jgi:hypothetical protein